MVNIKEVEEKIKIPENVQVTLENDVLTVKGEKGELSRSFSHPKIKMSLKNNTVVIFSQNVRRKDKALIGTFVAHINNMIKGVTEGFEYHMKTVFSHFPIKTSVEDGFFVIQNFLGERAPRKAKILEGVNVEIKGEKTILTGIDKEKIGQTAANIERATRVKNRDVRVFQDGVYLVSKGGKKLL